MNKTTAKRPGWRRRGVHSAVRSRPVVAEYRPGDAERGHRREHSAEGSRTPQGIGSPLGGAGRAVASRLQCGEVAAGEAGVGPKCTRPPPHASASLAALHLLPQQCGKGGGTPHTVWVPEVRVYSERGRVVGVGGRELHRRVEEAALTASGREGGMEWGMEVRAKPHARQAERRHRRSHSAERVQADWLTMGCPVAR